MEKEYNLKKKHNTINMRFLWVLCVLCYFTNIICLKQFDLFHLAEKLKNFNIEKNANIILNKSQKIYKNDDLTPFFEENPQYVNKSLIQLTPGGIRGFYNLGTCVYIKENYDISDYIFSGASAGAWNSLMLSYKNNPHNFALKLLDSMKEKSKPKSIYETQLYLKNQLLECYNSDDFELDKLFLGLTNLSNQTLFTNIYGDFENLEDALNCCISSSNIPFITGNCEIKYKDVLSLDGYFSEFPYLKLDYDLQIGPDMWNQDDLLNNKKSRSYDLYRMFFYNNRNINFYELYIKGYSEAKNNKEILDMRLKKK